MDSLEIISQLEALLAEEREAIVRLDGVRVATLADRKLGLAHALEKTPATLRASAAGRMKALVRKLRTNGALLAQARGILSSVLVGTESTMRVGAGASSRPVAPHAARHLSIRA